VKSLVRALLLVPLVLALAGCHGLAPRGAVEPAAPRLSKILERRELRVGLTGNQPPLNMRSRGGEIIGLEVDVVRALTESMGLAPRFVEMPFAELLPALERGDVDLVISGLTITPERNARVAFVGPYLISGKSVLTKSAKLAAVDSPEVLDDPARVYAALAGSTSERFVKELLPKARIRTTPDYDTAVRLVIDDEVDALVADFPICAVSVLRHPDAGLTALMTPFTIEPLGIALPADDPLFVNLVQNYLNTLEGTGLLTRFKAKWFTGGEWLSELP
jgi:polar amino acid transport system substrate-binding protein